MKKTQTKKIRIPFLDTLRGFMLISMILYHGCWNYVYLYGGEWSWYENSKGAYYWQQSICCTFIFISGFCFSFSKKKIRNGGIIFFSGALVSLVTGLMLPQNMVRFGVLTCIGSCILVTALWEVLLLRFPTWQSLVISFLLFLFTRQINRGYLGVGSRIIKELPGQWYASSFSAYLGFPPKDFSSTDYFSLFPWLFLFWTGFFTFRALKYTRIFEKRIMKIKVPIVNRMGQHSLFIYLIHQPILYLIGEIIYRTMIKK